MQEEALEFGTVSSAVKVGDTVRRQAGPWTPTIHALLQFLNEHDFAYAPTPLGMDEQGREIISYLPGVAASRPWPHVLLTDEGIKQAAKMLRSYHDIVQNFTPSTDAEWRIGKVPLLPGQIIRHGDLGPWNTLWRQDTLTGLIDWDFAEPGERITDLAQLAYYFIPLRGDDGWKQAGFTERPDFGQRLRLLCTHYGSFTPDEVLSELSSWLDEELRRMHDLGGQNIEPWASFVKRGDITELTQDKEWIHTLRAALA